MVNGSTMSYGHAAGVGAASDLIAGLIIAWNTPRWQV
jgi:hypothetical protein